MRQAEQRPQGWQVLLQEARCHAEKLACLQDARPGTPMFVFLSPGVDVAAAVEAMGQRLGYSAEKGNYHSVSLGQGQEPIAEQRLEHAHKNGGWVLLQNIHLTIDWTTNTLDGRVDKLSEGAHPNFRWAVCSACCGYKIWQPFPDTIGTALHGSSYWFVGSRSELCI